MAFGNKTNGFVKTNRFGNDELLVSLVAKKDKKTGNVVDGVYIGAVDIAGKTYYVEASPSKKESRDGRDKVWLKFTKPQARKQAKSF